MLRPMTTAPTASEEGRLPSADGLDLYWRAWRPQAAPRAVVLLVHGLNEHAGRYQNPVGYFVPRGYAWYAPDLRGHGRSAGLRGHVDGFDQYLGDVAAVTALAAERHPGVPRFLVGHSLGGLIAILFALRAPQGLTGVAVSSPSLGVAPASRPPAPLLALGRVLNVVWPTFRIDNGLDPAHLSKDPAVGRAYVADPLVGHKVSARWYASLQRAFAEAHAGAQRLSVPTLVLSAGADRMVDPEATRRWAARTPPGLCALVEWDGLFHECFNEPERQQVFERLESWLESRIGMASPTMVASS
jgi:alpha-beta hydrolase superfamily lysophospholipase